MKLDGIHYTRKKYIRKIVYINIYIYVHLHICMFKKVSALFRFATYWFWSKLGFWSKKMLKPMKKQFLRFLFLWEMVDFVFKILRKMTKISTNVDNFFCPKICEMFFLFAKTVFPFFFSFNKFFLYLIAVFFFFNYFQSTAIM